MSLVESLLAQRLSVNKHYGGTRAKLIVSELIGTSSRVILSFTAEMMLIECRRDIDVADIIMSE